MRKTDAVDGLGGERTSCFLSRLSDWNALGEFEIPDALLPTLLATRAGPCRRIMSAHGVRSSPVPKRVGDGASGEDWSISGLRRGAPASVLQVGLRVRSGDPEGVRMRPAMVLPGAVASLQRRPCFEGQRSPVLLILRSGLGQHSSA